jgi:hypothetical protein
MYQIISTKESIHISAFFLLITIFLTTFTCTHNTSSNPNESEELEAELVSIRNPNIIIHPPVTFTWVPESIKSYDDPGLKDFPVHETVQKAITESLIRNGYLHNKSTYSLKSIIKRKRKGANIQPQDLILVKSWTWAGPNFGAGGFLKELTLENRSNQDAKDLRMRIDYLGTMGPKEGYGGPTSIFVIHDVLPATSEKTFENINIGFRHPDARSENIRVLSVKTVTDDLSIGYTLVSKNALNDHDIDRINDIKVGLSANNDKINEYKNGTLVMDVIDPETKVLIWRGAVHTLTSFYIPEDTKKNRITRAVEKLVDDFIKSNK